jgi:nodulation protein F
VGAFVVKDNIEEQLLQVIKKHCPAEVRDSICLDTPLEESGIDSLSMSEVIFELEDMFNISMPEQDVSSGVEFRTLRDVHDVVAKLLPARDVSAA